MAKPPVSEQVQVNFRMPVELRDRIKLAAEQNNRSMNAEIVASLEKEYPPPEPGINILAVAIDLALPGVRAATSDEEALKAIEAGNEVLAKTNLQGRLVLTQAGDKRAIGFIEK